MEFIYLVLIFAVVVLCVKNSEQKNELFEKEMEIEKEKLIKKLKKKDFYELIGIRDSCKAACVNLKKVYENKAYRKTEFQENYAMYKACAELASKKFNEDVHGSWFEYYDDGQI